MEWVGAVLKALWCMVRAKSQNNISNYSICSAWEANHSKHNGDMVRTQPPLHWPKKQGWCTSWNKLLHLYAYLRSLKFQPKCIEIMKLKRRNCGWWVGREPQMWELAVPMGEHQQDSKWLVCHMSLWHTHTAFTYQEAQAGCIASHQKGPFIWYCFM